MSRIATAVSDALGYWKFNSRSKPAVDANAMGYWTLDEASGTFADSSGNGNTGTGTNIGRVSPGFFGYSGDKLLWFDGTAYVNCGSGTSLNITSTLTIELWANPIVNNANMTLVSKWAVAASGKQYTITLGQDVSTNKMTFVISQADGTLKVLAPNVTFNAKEWMHIVAVADGTYLRLYKNGVEIGTPVAYDGTIRSTTTTVYLGRLRPDDTIYLYQGWMDNPIIYNRALSAVEILQHFNDGPTTVNDSGSGDQNGTLGPAAPSIPAWVSGVLGYSGNYVLDYDGITDYVKVNDSAAKYQIQTFSLECWIKRTDVTTYTYIEYGNIDAFYGWRLEGSGANAQFALHDATGTYVSTITIPGTYNDDKAHHIVVTVDNTTENKIKMYIDGRLGGEVASAAAVYSTGNMRLYFGNTRPESGLGQLQQYHGMLDNIIIWPDVLTADEALRHYGWPNNYMGVSHLDIGKINGIDVGNIYKVMGTT